MNMTKYTAGYNVPGYSPGIEGAEFSSFDEAKRFLVRQIKQSEDAVLSEDRAEDLAELAEDVNLWSGPSRTGVAGDGYVYWIRRA